LNVRLGRVWKKSIIIINKYETQWGEKPMNYLSPDWLRDFSSSVAHKCPDTSVVYSRLEKKGRDVALEPEQRKSQGYFGDYEALQNSTNVITLGKIMEAHSQLTYNEIQTRVAADHSCFVEVQGGRSFLFMLFEGRHAIFHMRGSQALPFYKGLMASVTGGDYDVTMPAGTEMTGAKDVTNVSRADMEAEFLRVVKDKFLTDACKRCALKAPKTALTAAVKATSQSQVASYRNFCEIGAGGNLVCNA